MFSDMGSASGLPIFGGAPSGVACHKRPAAYAVIPDMDGRVAAVCAVVRGRTSYWLPGGGTHAGETPEETVVREIREELGRSVQLMGRIGEAIQFFYAGDEERWYEMTATFFRAELDGPPLCAGEHQLHWLDASQQGELFFHACHVWAVSRREGETGPKQNV